MDIARESEESGLVHWGDCYCCDCCCENLFPITRAKRYDLMTPNRFLAVVDKDKCQGCQDCLERCKFDAIEMKKDTKSRKFKVYISSEKCKGCGLCVIKCKQDAIRMEIVKPMEYLKGRSTSVSGASGQVVPVWGQYYLK
jgi:Na+-translocating ferredoxin:NAD+ oxidoreductase RNF subunit RnfB